MPKNTAFKKIKSLFGRLLVKLKTFVCAMSQEPATDFHET